MFHSRQTASSYAESDNNNSELLKRNHALNCPWNTRKFQLLGWWWNHKHARYAVQAKAIAPGNIDIYLAASLRCRSKLRIFHHHTPGWRISSIRAIEYVDRFAEPWAISSVTALELIVGARDKRDLVVIDGFLSLYTVVPLSETIAAGAYRLLKTYATSHGLHVFDSLVAATAIDKALTSITLNRKHYQIIEGLQLQIPDYSKRRSRRATRDNLIAP
jgi:predicted nucleic acid-binding protein